MAIIVRDAKVPYAEWVTLMGIGCVALAIGTTLQALPRGPVGSGFLAPPVFSAAYLAPSVLAAEIGSLSLVFGMLLFAGLVEVAIALALERLRIDITEIFSGLVVFVAGWQPDSRSQRCEAEKTAGDRAPLLRDVTPSLTGIRDNSEKQ